ncbi:MAG: adenine deaminase [Bacteroidales bacterium]
MRIYGKIVDIFKEEIFNGFIDVEGNIIKETGREENAEERYILPGLIDSHIHIESSMLVPSRFAETAVQHGTVAVVSDPHEIANVLGREGVEYMIDNAAEVPLKFYFGAPSCVPATVFETAGGTLDEADIKDLLGRDKIKYLAEMMNFPGVIGDDDNVRVKIEIARKYGKPVDGHAPGLRGKDLDKYIGAGISTDHESISLEEAREKLEKGMKVQIREGSAARSLDRFHYLIAEKPSGLMLCSDDLHPEMLADGHINLLVKRLLGYGYDLFDILKIVVLNPVQHYDLDVGMLRRGDKADFIIIDNPEEFNINETWINGVKVFDGDSIGFKSPPAKVLNNFNSSYIKAGDIAVKRKEGKIRVINITEGDLVTGVYVWKPGSRGVFVEPDIGDDIHKIIVKDRYKDSAPAVAFIKGFGIRRGAFASSVAHDSHNIIAAGCDDESISRVVNMLVEMKGGLALTDGQSSMSLPLEVAGLMTDVPCGTVAEKYEKMSERLKDMGCKLKSPFMTLSFMALPVIPELKITDRGLFDVSRFDFVDIFI